MGRLKAYAWEWDKFPAAQGIEVSFDRRALLCESLGRAWGMHVVASATTRGRGLYGGARHSAEGVYHSINLPGQLHPCSLGLVLHELAHAYDRQFLNGGKGHTGTFKKALIKLYCEYPQHIVAATERVAAKLDALHKATAAARARAAREEERRAAVKARRESPEYQLERLEERIKRSEARLKLWTGIVRRLKRSFAAKARYHALKSNGGGSVMKTLKTVALLVLALAGSVQAATWTEGFKWEKPEPKIAFMGEAQGSQLLVGTDLTFASYRGIEVMLGGSTSLGLTDRMWYSGLRAMAPGYVDRKKYLRAGLFVVRDLTHGNYRAGIVLTMRFFNEADEAKRAQEIKDGTYAPKPWPVVTGSALEIR